MFYKKATLINVIGKHLCRSLFLNKVSCQQAKERLVHYRFPVGFTKYFRMVFFAKHLCVTVQLNTLFCLLRGPQPQNMCPSTLVILNIFETNTVNCLRTALCRDPRQTVSWWLTWFIANRASDMSEMLLEIRSSRPAVFCKNEIL